MLTEFPVRRISFHLHDNTLELNTVITVILLQRRTWKFREGKQHT